MAFREGILHICLFENLGLNLQNILCILPHLYHSIREEDNSYTLTFLHPSILVNGKKHKTFRYHMA